ncbi:MAG: DUF3918 family protein [Candidatus Fournierella pullistercoris]|uniref:DUF3918 family protein n=1 Tax=Candidatus Allofournierella pullistercoris TaxID=2838597 RepID=A0A948T3C4_9FIRM|nr:DUF3918 family protein [Candidatus Fournierella pullistercoris]
MGIWKQVISMVVGIGAGALAYKLVQDYNARNKTEVKTEFESQEPQDQPEQEAKAEQSVVQYPARPDNGPNVNPVSLGTLEKPIDHATGKLDATRIASQEDFGDWDEWGCQG